MQYQKAADCMGELGSPIRLRIFHFLVKAGPDGAPVGEIQSVLRIPSSTLSHHISRLVAVGLVRQRRQGRTLFCHPEVKTLERLIEFLLSECCKRSHKDCC